MAIELNLHRTTEITDAIDALGASTLAGLEGRRRWELRSWRLREDIVACQVRLEARICVLEVDFHVDWEGAEPVLHAEEPRTIPHEGGRGDEEELLRQVAELRGGMAALMESEVTLAVLAEELRRHRQDPQERPGEPPPGGPRPRPGGPDPFARSVVELSSSVAHSMELQNAVTTRHQRALLATMSETWDRFSHFHVRDRHGEGVEGLASLGRELHELQKVLLQGPGGEAQPGPTVRMQVLEGGLDERREPPAEAEGTPHLQDCTVHTVCAAFRDTARTQRQLNDLVVYQTKVTEVLFTTALARLVASRMVSPAEECD